MLGHQLMSCRKGDWILKAVTSPRVDGLAGDWDPITGGWSHTLLTQPFAASQLSTDTR